MKYKGQYTNEIPYDGEFYEVYQLLFDTKLCKLDNLMAAYDEGKAHQSRT